MDDAEVMRRLRAASDQNLRRIRRKQTWWYRTLAWPLYNRTFGYWPWTTAFIKLRLRIQYGPPSKD